ncbi:hypothetical protein E1A91_A01G239600v1 [Gossypium mustelinum]|nr:hypothetical protein E1A91_A01G239600v1 [Gossypium mustelinum]
MMILTLTVIVPKLRPPTCIGQINCIDPSLWQLSILYAGLTLMAIGAGGIRPCNIAFGADQFNTTTKEGRSQLESFFNWWYFSFTFALVIALTAVVYIQTNISWVIGFAIPTAFVKPQGSVFVDLVKVITAATRKHRLDCSRCSFYDPDFHPRTKQLRCLEKAAAIADQNELDEDGKPKNGWRLCNIQQVENLKLLLGMMPVCLAGIGCFMTMDQQTTIGILQAIQSNNILWVLQTKKLTGKAKRLTMTQRINIGLISAMACSIVASFIEKKRRTAALKHGSFKSPMSILMLLPQFALSGLVEAFAAVAIMEYLTTQLPESMRTVAGAIFFISLSMASYLNSMLVNIVHKTTKKGGKTSWLGGHNLNNDKLENFYYLAASIEAFNFLYFNLYARRFIATSCTINEESKEDQHNNEDQI